MKVAVTKISFVVCGKFHYHRYVKYILSAKRLDVVYFSHKRGETLELPRKFRCNIYLKEYFLQGLIRLRGIREWYFSVAHGIWGLGLRLRFQPSDVNIFLLHGNSLSQIEACKRAGKVVIGEAVNSHPLVLDELLRKEAARCGLPAPVLRNLPAILKEIEACDYILCPSAAVANSFRQSGVLSERLISIPYAFDRPDSSLSGRSVRSSRTDFTVLCVGQLSLRKAQHRLLDALDELNWKVGDRAISLTLVGAYEEDYKAYLLARAPHLKCINHVENRDMQQFMAQYDLLVLPSVEDGFGLVVLEAIAAGVPVIVSKYCGASEIIAAGNDGAVQIVDPLDAATFSVAILKAFEVVLGGVRRTGELVERGYSWQDYSDKLLLEIDSALERAER